MVPWTRMTCGDDHDLLVLAPANPRSELIKVWVSPGPAWLLLPPLRSSSQRKVNTEYYQTLHKTHQPNNTTSNILCSNRHNTTAQSALSPPGIWWLNVMLCCRGKLICHLATTPWTMGPLHKLRSVSILWLICYSDTRILIHRSGAEQICRIQKCTICPLIKRNQGLVAILQL